jgi:hypothetical protein
MALTPEIECSKTAMGLPPVTFAVFFLANFSKIWVSRRNIWNTSASPSGIKREWYVYGNVSTHPHFRNISLRTCVHVENAFNYIKTSTKNSICKPLNKLLKALLIFLKYQRDSKKYIYCSVSSLILRHFSFSFYSYNDLKIILIMMYLLTLLRIHDGICY